MNAGELPRDHWVYTEEGGGRNRGEACHIYDLFTFLTGARIRSVDARGIRLSTGRSGQTENFVATLTFEDGSLATLTYTAMGAKSYPKEKMEAYVGGRIIELDDYRRLSVHGGRVKGMETKGQEKGHLEELEAFSRVVLGGGEWPIPLWQQIQATEIALAVEERLKT